MSDNVVTFSWPPEWAARPEYGFRLSESIAAGARGWCFAKWWGVLAANLATASLLGRAADVAYENGRADSRWDENNGPYPRARS